MVVVMQPEICPFPLARQDCQTWLGKFLPCREKAPVGAQASGRLRATVVILVPNTLWSLPAEHRRAGLACVANRAAVAVRSQGSDGSTNL